MSFESFEKWERLGTARASQSASPSGLLSRWGGHMPSNHAPANGGVALMLQSPRLVAAVAALGSSGCFTFMDNPDKPTKKRLPLEDVIAPLVFIVVMADTAVAW